jgi:HEAT repeat protein
MTDGISQVTLAVPCAAGSHDVTFVVTCWGEVTVSFNPCMYLPASVRRLAGSTCEAHAEKFVQCLERTLQQMWLPVPYTVEEAKDDPEVAPIAEKLQNIMAFAAFVANQRSRLAQDILAMGAAGCEPSADVPLSAKAALDWATFVLADPDSFPERAIFRRRVPVGVLTAAAFAQQWNDPLLCLRLYERIARDSRVLAALRQKCLAEIAESGGAEHLRWLTRFVCAQPNESIRTASALTLLKILRRLSDDDRRRAVRTVLGVAVDRGKQRFVELIGLGADFLVAELVDGMCDLEVTVAALCAELLGHALCNVVELNAAERLLNAAVGHAQSPVRQSAANALRKLFDSPAWLHESAIPLLSRMVQKGNVTFVLLGLNKLREIASPRSLKVHWNIAELSKIQPLRIGAIDNLGRVGDAAALSRLLSLRSDRHRDVAEAAEDALVNVIAHLPDSDDVLPQLRVVSRCRHEAAASEASQKLRRISRARAKELSSAVAQRGRRQPAV